MTQERQEAADLLTWVLLEGMRLVSACWRLLLLDHTAEAQELIDIFCAGIRASGECLARLEGTVPAANAPPAAPPQASSPTEADQGKPSPDRGSA